MNETGKIQVPAKALLEMRDALALGKTDQAYSILYGLACPERDRVEAWTHWEVLALAEGERDPEFEVIPAHTPGRKYEPDGTLIVEKVGLLLPLKKDGEIVTFPNPVEGKAKKILPLITGRILDTHLFFHEQNTRYAIIYRVAVIGLEKPLLVNEAGIPPLIIH